jgi:SNF2 family DNA or RNA helicase
MIKNPDAQVTRAVNTLRADYRFALTGTPIENRLSELWSIFNFTNHGYLGSRSKFRKEFALPIENYQDPVALARLQRMVRPFILRRLKTDPRVIQDLPERLEMDVFCTLTEEQATLYQRVVEESLPRIADARGSQRRIHVFNLLTKLKQILNHPVQYLHSIGPNTIPKEPLAGRSGKLDRLVAMLEELLEVGDKALVFTQFAEMGFLLADYLPRVLDTPVLYLHGGVPGRKRQEMVTRFQEDPYAPPIFILTLKAGGLGLNLTAANHVFHYDRWWNPAVEKQAADRIFRIGQTRNVQIHKFITAGTLEENIQEMLERKRHLAESIIGTDEGWLAQLSNEELEALVTLHEDKLL